MLEHNLEEAQSGFRKGRSAQDHIFTIKQLIEKSRQKSKQFREETSHWQIPTGNTSLYSKTWNYEKTENKQSNKF